MNAVSLRCSPHGRMIAIFSCYERPGVLFSEEERAGFYGRAG